VRGRSNLWLESGLVSTCIDSPDEQDLKRIAMASFNAIRNATPGTVRQTPSAVYLDRIHVLKRLILKAPSSTSDEGQHS
jgi:hypothetical protein